jgi:SAM-dependent methyltransferase
MFRVLPLAAAAATHDLQTAPEGPSKERPFGARLKTNRRLSGASSEKDVRHFEIALGASGLTYEAGDALGVWPSNCPALVDELLAALGCSGDEVVPGRAGAETSLRSALLYDYEIARIPIALLRHVATASRDTVLTSLTAPEVNGELTAYLRDNTGAFDVIVSADTLVYFGPLEAVAGAAANALRPGGRLIFTLEESFEDRSGTGYGISLHGRYCHTRDYVERVLTGADLEPDIVPAQLRLEAGEPVQGLVVCARKRTGTGMNHA